MKKIALLITVLLLSLPVIAQENNEEKPAVYIDNVAFDYELTEHSNSLLCWGTLNLKVHFPAGAVKVVAMSTKPHLLELGWHIYTTKKGYDVTDDNITSTEFTFNRVSWGVFFRAQAIMENGESIFSDAYCSSDYMDPEDLKVLIDQAGVSDIEASEAKVRVEGKSLIVDSDCPVTLVVSDLNGRCVFNGEVNQSAVIPLDSVTSPFVIVRYISNNKAYTKKYTVK